MNKYKLMNAAQIKDFIKKMPYNSGYAAIASDYTESDDEIEGEGWWSIIKLKYADAENLIFDYFGGGYPLVYCIDGQNSEDTVEHAVNNFLRDNASFYGYNKKYVIDTSLTSIENLRSTGIKDVDGNMIYEGDTVAILNTADNNAIAEGEIVFCAGAYGIRTTEVIDYNFLVSEIPQWCGAENSEHFSWCDNFISLWELMWNFGHEENICSSVKKTNVKSAHHNTETDQYYHKIAKEMQDEGISSHDIKLAIKEIKKMRSNKK